VQVGAFASRDNARKLADDLERRGYPAVAVEPGDGPEALFHVRFGRYPDQGAAVHAAEEVSAALGLRYQLVPPPEEPVR
jgi:cell division septation protein DedD